MIVLHSRGGPHRLDQAVEIGGGVNRENAGQRGRRSHLDPGDPGMGVIAATKRDMKRAGHGMICREGALAGQQPRVFAPPNPCPDMFRPQGHRFTVPARLEAIMAPEFCLATAAWFMQLRGRQINPAD
jgi:hypothetical protein